MANDKDKDRERTERERRRKKLEEEVGERPNGGILPVTHEQIEKLKKKA
jgi:hypothetical protein